MYPYYKTIYNLKKKKILSLVKNLKIHIYYELTGKFQKYKLEKFNNKKYVIIEDIWAENYELNNLTDYFTEEVRVKCAFGNYPSPLEYWNKNKEIIIKKYISIIEQRDFIYNNTKLCNNFRISLAINILKLFKPKKWLDISAGWGDRLLAALLYKVDLYYATDPNKELHKYYKKMINTFANKNKKNFIILDKGFETLDIPYNDFDIVFSSPPFFDLEKYSNYENDSLVKYNNEKKWTQDFLMKSLYKAYDHLKIGGYMLLYMGGSEYVINEMHKLDNIMKYQGCIYYYDRLPRAIYVWKK